GQMFPENLDRAPAGLVVVVDTQPPEVDVRSITGANGQTYMHGIIQDANPDYASMRMDYFEGGKWKPLNGMPEMAGVFVVSDPKALSSRLRVFAADRAGNSVTREIDMRSGVEQTAPVNALPLAPEIPKRPVQQAGSSDKAADRPLILSPPAQDLPE